MNVSFNNLNVNQEAYEVQLKAMTENLVRDLILTYPEIDAAFQKKLRDELGL
jgi:hypothetical protein